MPAVAIRITQEVGLDHPLVAPERTIAVAGKIAFAKEVFEQSHIGKQTSCRGR
jgi:hypothetical protein